MKTKVFKINNKITQNLGEEVFLIYGQIYAIKNKINNKVYIGQTIRRNVLERYNGSIRNTHNIHLKNSIDKYGEDNFEIITLCWCESKEEMNQKEIEYIEIYNALDSAYGYNLAFGGTGGAQPEEVRKRTSETMKKVWENDPLRRERMSANNIGENNPMHKSKGGHTLEARHKMSETKKRKFADGTLKISENAIKAINTKEVRKKMAEGKSKYVYIQYDENMNEVYKTYILKELYEYMKENNLGLTVKTYGGFKNPSCKKVVFNEKGFCGYYYKMIKKEDYVNTEVS